MRAGLHLDAVRLTVAGRTLIDGLSLTVAPGSAATVMGPSGCGKSSLLAFVSGALDPAFQADGRVLLDGRDLGREPPERRRIGILFQDDLLFPHLSVGENLAFGLVRTATKGRAARRARVEAALAAAGLTGFADRDPASLSGGQRTRAALLRTLLAEPAALLLDEPFARLDPALRQEIRTFVLEHARASRLPTLLVTHDPADATAAGGPVIMLDQFRAGETSSGASR